MNLMLPNILGWAVVAWKFLWNWNYYGLTKWICEIECCSSFDAAVRRIRMLRRKSYQICEVAGRVLNFTFFFLFDDLNKNKLWHLAGPQTKILIKNPENLVTYTNAIKINRCDCDIWSKILIFNRAFHKSRVLPNLCLPHSFWPLLWALKWGTV